MHSVFIIFLSLSFLLIPAYSSLSYDPTQSKAILAVCHINDDATKDTVLAYAVQVNYRWQLRPECIRWGLDTTTPGGISLPLKKTNTWFRYPGWNSLKCVAAIDKFDSDTLYDIMFIFSGSYNPGSGARDTTRAVHLFGQRDLITIDTVKLDLINSLQESPYVATRLTTSANFLEPGIRDNSGLTSYLFISPALSDTSGSPKQGEPQPVTIPEIRLYPNPAIYTAYLEAKKLPAGEYRLRILSIQGTIVQEHGIRLRANSEIRETLELNDLSTGCYFLQVFSGTNCLATYPFTILH